MGVVPAVGEALLDRSLISIMPLSRSTPAARALWSGWSMGTYSLLGVPPPHHGITQIFENLHQGVGAEIVLRTRFL